ncbi:MAG TPA: AIR synthase related protein, partial [Acidimicrobiales bacterium]|nr:AIR synthase related protein [Acidimicrobiales bacterium]
AVVADVPASSLADDAPLYERPLQAAPAPPAVRPVDDTQVDAEGDLLALLYDPSFVFRQYDHRLFLNTVVAPGAGDATVLKLSAPGVPWTGKGLALTCDANPGWCAVSPRLGTALTVAEAVLNVSIAGARPVAVVDCMNFGNPEHSEVMWQLSESVDGMADACRAFGVPVVGGNVSLYNESDGSDIDPTPVVGLVGLIDSLQAAPPAIALVSGQDLVLVGPAGDTSIGGSRWARQVRGDFGGPLPPLDFATHWSVCDFVCRLVADSRGGALLSGLHDVSDGGLAVCLAELCCASEVGAVISTSWTAPDLFNEAPSRVVVCTAEPAELLSRAEAAGVCAVTIGRAGGDRLVVPGRLDLAVADLVRARSNRLLEAAERASA